MQSFQMMSRLEFIDYRAKNSKHRLLELLSKMAISVKGRCFYVQHVLHTVKKHFISNEKDIEDKLVEQVINLIKTNNISDENVIKITETIGSR